MPLGIEMYVCQCAEMIRASRATSPVPSLGSLHHPPWTAHEPLKDETCVADAIVCVTLQLSLTATHGPAIALSHWGLLSFNPSQQLADLVAEDWLSPARAFAQMP
jgi:hypothetical protein